MANAQFQENQAALNDQYYDSHRALIERVCIALNKLEKVEEMTKMLLGEKLKLKFKKDPNKPKKPKSGFLFFCDELRPDLIKNHKVKYGKVVIGNIAKELGAKWKKLTNKQKNVYNDKKETDKYRYSQEMEAYNNKIYNLS